LITLKGAPEHVGGTFDCGFNKLISLEGAPEYVGGYFYCNNNKLVTLKGIGTVKGKVRCKGNPVPEDGLLRTRYDKD